MSKDKLGRTPFSPQPGTVYENAGGGSYRCEGLLYGAVTTAWMTNVKSGWRFLAHGVGIYPDGKIDWDYSTGGAFHPKKGAGE